MGNFVNTYGVLRQISPEFCSPKLSKLVDFSPIIIHKNTDEILWDAVYIPCVPKRPPFIFE